MPGMVFSNTSLVFSETSNASAVANRGGIASRGWRPNRNTLSNPRSATCCCSHSLILPSPTITQRMANLPREASATSRMAEKSCASPKLPANKMVKECGSRLIRGDPSAGRLEKPSSAQLGKYTSRSEGISRVQYFFTLELKAFDWRSK
ncbi:hypothetical protein D9M71_708390 [compost metagenome]